MRWNRSFKLLRPYIDWQYKLLIDRAVCDGFWIIEFLVANKFGGDRIGKLLVDRSIRKGISRFAKAMRARALVRQGMLSAQPLKAGPKLCPERRERRM